MPRLKYPKLYDKQYSTGETAVSHKFYDPDPEYTESGEMRRRRRTHSRSKAESGNSEEPIPAAQEKDK